MSFAFCNAPLRIAWHFFMSRVLGGKEGLEVYGAKTGDQSGTEEGEPWQSGPPNV